MKALITALTLTISMAAAAGTAYLTGSRMDGTVQHCYYDYLGQTYIVTVSSSRMCPMTIEV